MSEAHPKHPNEIPIRIIDRSIEDGLVSSMATTTEATLGEKIRDYTMRLGYSSAHITGIIIQLLTKGKVRVDFRGYTERLELASPADQTTSTQAMTMLSAFLAELSSSQDSDENASNMTQRIVVPLPKMRRPG